MYAGHRPILQLLLSTAKIETIVQAPEQISRVNPVFPFVSLNRNYAVSPL